MCDLRELTENSKALLENIASSAVPNTSETNKNSYERIKDLTSSTVISALDHAVPVLEITKNILFATFDILRTEQVYNYIANHSGPILAFFDEESLQSKQNIFQDWKNCAHLGMEHITKKLSKAYNDSKDVYNVSRETALGVLYLPLLLQTLFLNQKQRLK